jgi:hypothetical protein
MCPAFFCTFSKRRGVTFEAFYHPEYPTSQPIMRSVLISVFFAIKRCRLNPVGMVKKAMGIYVETGNLPQLEEFTAPGS